MADDKLAQKRNMSGDPVDAKPNHVREKTYDAPTKPTHVREAEQSLPENTTRDKVREEMSIATREVKKQAKGADEDDASR